ncbi:MAG TPA: hypothetical protein P5056_03330, partial [Candidatus Paceibacterota bacterium]|nr:hypothetical protein [Candidatus Paceibacterota bacterium]
MLTKLLNKKYFLFRFIILFLVCGFGFANNAGAEVAFVQSKAVDSWNLSSFSVTFDSSVTAGNIIAVS